MILTVWYTMRLQESFFVFFKCWKKQHYSIYYVQICTTLKNILRCLRIFSEVKTCLIKTVKY